MIHGIFANKDTFRPVEFSAGLNVIVADRRDTSSQKDTRNGVGKTTLINIIHFCLGADAPKGKGLNIEPLSDWAFTVDITLAGKRVRATRAIESPKRIRISGDTTGWMEQPDTDEDSGERIFNLDRWRTLLGWSLFGLERSYDEFKYKPSFRSLISYFIRKTPDAYISVFKHFGQQKTWDKQLNIAYLLGLDWAFASKLQDIRDHEKGIKAINDAIKSGILSEAFGTIGEMEAERVQLETIFKRERSALEDFKVHPQYETIQAEADKLTQVIHKLTNDNIIDKRKLHSYHESIEAEAIPDNEIIDSLYQEVGLIFPDNLKKTIHDAKEFHEHIVSNRKDFLTSEVNRIENRITERETEISRLASKRSDSVSILASHGALQELSLLHEKHSETKSNLDRVIARIADLRDIASRKRQLKRDKDELVESAEIDYQERESIRSNAVRIFNANSNTLYESPGKLIINTTDTGYKYDVQIQSSGSTGIDKMKTYCFDMMLLELFSSNDSHINFLIHDSQIFDGVDARQIAKAIENAAELTEVLDSQYICTINSDMIPESDFSSDFKFNNYIKLELTDSDPTGSLLGFRF